MILGTVSSPNFCVHTVLNFSHKCCMYLHVVTLFSYSKVQLSDDDLLTVPEIIMNNLSEGTCTYRGSKVPMNIQYIIGLINEFPYT